jgi:hypothetical protein
MRRRMIRGKPRVRIEPENHPEPSGQPGAADVSRGDPLGSNGAQIAQLVEQRIENPRVGGSIPSLGTTFQKNMFRINLMCSLVIF